MASGVVSNIGVGAPVVVTPTVGQTPSGNVTAAPVRPVEPVLPAAAILRGGNPPPSAGESLPGAQAAAAEPQLAQLQAAVDGINRFLRDNQRQMVFQVDLKSGKATLTIINPATGDVIRQIPAVEVMTAAANLQQAGLRMTGMFIDERA